MEHHQVHSLDASHYSSFTFHPSSIFFFTRYYAIRSFFLAVSEADTWTLPSKLPAISRLTSPITFCYQYSARHYPSTSSIPGWISLRRRSAPSPTWRFVSLISSMCSVSLVNAIQWLHRATLRPSPHPSHHHQSNANSQTHAYHR